MRDDAVAISLKDVSKSYRLYGSQRDQLMDVLGLTRFGLLRIKPVQEFKALDGVSFDVPQGGRMAIIGRNGAGKTTLLKLISGNFAATAGKISVIGSVQALMGTGLGFHPEFTGIENIKASLHYNGLSHTELMHAINDIVDFCELGQFIDQPFKTYSLGMQARLMFATATAIRPDILIVDEVLGAGDAYFSAKSSLRMQALASSGCTLLLVSHSTQQVLQFCDRAAWLEAGRVRMIDDAFRVVKAYEEFINNRRIAHTSALSAPGEAMHEAGSDNSALAHAASDKGDEQARREPIGFNFVAPGGLSRWAGDVGLKVCGFAILVDGQTSNILRPLEDAEFRIQIVAEIAGSFRCTYGIVIHDALGNVVCRLISARDEFDSQQGNVRTIRVFLRPNRLGPGAYTLGISVLEATEASSMNQARRYDLLGRSFHFNVLLPDSKAALACNFFHDAEWTFTNVPNLRFPVSTGA
jgi:lipopolysaccharide transport system ATP-binding protein